MVVRSTAMRRQHPVSPMSSGVVARVLMRRRTSLPWPLSHGTSLSGGKKNAIEFGCGALENAALVAFESENVVGSVVLGDEAGGFLLAMHGVGAQERTLDGEAFEQGFDGGDFVAFFRNWHGAQGSAQLVGDDGKQGKGPPVLPSRASQDLAVDGKSLELGDVLFEEPSSDDGFHVGGVDEAQHAVKGGVAGNSVALGFRVVVATQGAELAFGKALADILEALVAAGSQERGHGGAGQRAGGSMVEAVSPARVFEGSEALVEASELPCFQRTGSGDVGFLLQQEGREAGTAECFARSGFEFPQVEGFGLPVFGVVIARVTGKSGARSNLLKSAGAVAGAAEAAFVHETFHQQGALLPTLLPILGDPSQRQTQNFRCQVGMALPLDEEQKPAVVDNESQSPSPLPGTPAHPFFALLQMRGRAAECQDRHPVAIHLGDIAQVAASDSRALEVVLAFEQLIESLSFLLFDKAKTHAGKKVIGDCLDFHFPCSCQKKWKMSICFSLGSYLGKTMPSQVKRLCGSRRSLKGDTCGHS